MEMLGVEGGITRGEFGDEDSVCVWRWKGSMNSALKKLVVRVDKEAYGVDSSAERARWRAFDFERGQRLHVSALETLAVGSVEEKVHCRRGQRGTQETLVLMSTTAEKFAGDGGREARWRTATKRTARRGLRWRKDLKERVDGVLDVGSGNEGEGSGSVLVDLERSSAGKVVGGGQVRKET